jgi:hypothetical protein
MLLDLKFALLISWLVMPPSTVICEPVIYAASSLARNTAVYGYIPDIFKNTEIACLI